MRTAILLCFAACAAWAQPAIDKYLDELAQTAFRDRAASIQKLTKAGVTARQAHVRERMMALIGGLPNERGPLNARVTGGFTRAGYRVENLVYESLPGFYVTANVYVPLGGQGPYPALVGVAGHSANGKASATYQHVWITLARRGFIVLAFDPPGQGERSETLDVASGIGRVPIGTGEHTLTGTQALLSGGHIARYEIWDGVRAVDYLETRRDVDPKRIAVAGNSGGGTQASYLAVADPRLAAIVSSCYMTSWRQLWTKPGPQDAEQVFPGFLKEGFDFGDFALAAAPKPFLMTTAIRDFFPIDGARETYQEIKRFYAAVDAEAKAGYFEYDDTHGWSQPRREAAYRWLEQWLKGSEREGGEETLVTEPEQLLYATKTGQVLSSLGGETTQSLQAKEAARLYPTRTAAAKGVDRGMVLSRTAMAGPDARLYDWKVEVPKNSQGRMPAVIAINATKEDVAAMVDSGHVVANIQLASSTGRESGYSSQYQTANRAFLVGRTLIGLQLSDVEKANSELTARSDVDGTRIRLYGRGNGAVVALHAAYLLPKVESVALDAMPLSWYAITQAKFHRGMIDIVIPGVLKDYDLPDLAAAIAPRKVWLVDTRTPAGVPMLVDEVKAVYPKAEVGYRPEGWAFRKVYSRWLGQRE